MADRQKPINIDHVVSYLSRAFSHAIYKSFSGTSKNTKGTKLYEFQTEFMYIIHDIQYGPLYIAPKRITQANELIEHVANFRA